MKVRYNRITNKQHQAIHSEVTKEFAKHLKTYNREAAMQTYQKERYELPDSDTPWLCEKQLSEDGINIEELFGEGGSE